MVKIGTRHPARKYQSQEGSTEPGSRAQCLYHTSGLQLQVCPRICCPSQDMGNHPQFKVISSLNWCNKFWSLNISYSVHCFPSHCYYSATSPLSSGLKQLLPKTSPCILPWPLQAKLLSGAGEIFQKHNLIISLSYWKPYDRFLLPLG